MQQVQFSESTRLFAMPNFLCEMARAFDLGNTYTNYNYSKSETVADNQALLSDWYQVGLDLNGAMEQMSDEQ